MLTPIPAEARFVKDELYEQFYAEVDEVLLAIAAAGVPLHRVVSDGPKFEHGWHDGTWPKMVFEFDFLPESTR